MISHIEGGACGSGEAGGESAEIIAREEGRKKVHYRFPKTIMAFQATVKHKVHPFPLSAVSSWPISTEGVFNALHPSDTLNLASR